MKIVRLIVFVVLITVFALFAFANWVRVPVNLPDGSNVLIFLPVIVLLSVVAGWLPMLLVHLASRSTWRRRAARVERLLDEAQASGPRVAPLTDDSPAPHLTSTT